MVNDLIVMTFGDEAAALRARRALEQLPASPFLGITSTLVVIRDRAGKLVVHEQWELSDHGPSAHKQVPRLLVEALFGQSPEYRGQKLISAGLDEVFVGKVVTALGLGSSLMLSYIWQGSAVDTRQVLDAIGQFKGTIFHTTVPAEVEEALLKEAGCE